MRLPKDLIERKLSAVLNARVAIDGLNVALFAGALDATGVTVTADGAAEPVLRVRRIKAEVAMGAILRKEIIIKSVVIEGPVVTIVRTADGSTNLPKRTTTSPHMSTTDDVEDDAPSSWKLA